MRLSEWRAAAPSREAGSQKVAAQIDPVLAALGADDDPHCWIVWGDEPAVRYTILVPTAAGLVTCFVRVNIPGEGTRASAKLVRWNRVQVGELAIEGAEGHRLLSFQVEGHVLRGTDAEADFVAAFALELFAAADGRPRPERPAATGRPRARRHAASGASAGRTASASAKPRRGAAVAAGRRTGPAS
jgi:hypothetical protein